MSRRWRIARFVGLAVVIYPVLVVAWPLARPAYLGAWRGAMEMLYGHIAAGMTLEYRAPDPPTDGADTERYMVKGGVFAKKRTSARLRGYLPTAILIALVTATPIPWRRRWRALAWGVLALAALHVLGEGVTLVDYLARSDPPQQHPMHSFDLWPPVAFLARCGAIAFSQSTATIFALPVVVWAVVAGREGIGELMNG